MTKVCTGRRSEGASSKIEMSRIPEIDICKVLGIGVAVIDKTSTVGYFSLIPSL